MLEQPGPAGAPTVVLLHGVALTAELNWSRVLPVLARHFSVVALDQRGHGDGIPADPWQLEDCADDVAALVAALELSSVVVVGFSMGGTVAQLVYRRHPQLVSGLVLCSTARNMRGTPVEHMTALALPGVVASLQWNPVAQLVGTELLRGMLLGVVGDPRTRAWAEEQLRRTDLTTVAQAAQAVSAFSSHQWIGEVEVPTAVVVTRHDALVPPSRQRRLAAAIRGARLVELDADHGVFLTHPALFAGAVETACRAVTAGSSASVLPA